MRLMWTVRRSVHNSGRSMLWVTMSWGPWMSRLSKINLMWRRNRLWAPWQSWRTLVIIGRLSLQVGRGYERNIGCWRVLTDWASRKRFWPNMTCRARRNWNITRWRKNSDFLRRTWLVIASGRWMKDGRFAARTRPHTTRGSLRWVPIHLWTLFSHGMARTGMWNWNIWSTVIVSQNHFGRRRMGAVCLRWRWGWYQSIDDRRRKRRWIELALYWGMALNPTCCPITRRHVLAKSMRGGCILCHSWVTRQLVSQRIL